MITNKTQFNKEFYLLLDGKFKGVDRVNNHLGFVRIRNILLLRFDLVSVLLIMSFDMIKLSFIRLPTLQCANALAFGGTNAYKSVKCVSAMQVRRQRK